MRFGVLGSPAFSVPYLSLFLVFILAFGYGSRLVREGKLDPGSGDIVLVLLGVTAVADGCGKVVNRSISPASQSPQMLPWLTQIREAQSIAADVFDVIDRQSAIDPFSDDGAHCIVMIARRC